MPKVTRDTPKERMREIANADVARIKLTKQTDVNGREYSWDEEQGIFVHIDDDGKEWFKGIDSSVPGYWFYCPEVTGHTSRGFEIVCRHPNFVFLHQDGEKLTCKKCKKECTVDLKLDG